MSKRLDQQRKFRSVSARKRFGEFKSPLRKSEERQAEETPASVQRDNQTLQARLSELDEEITRLQNEGCKEEELQLHIKKMHEYNELKDMAQMLLGRIASLEGVTTRQLHEEMGIHDGD
ncbi:DNA repair protein SWI5 homolog [Diadema antillarum]|uniref:DNA repair protein SWI5 homolog n=1 Tax=Diadema antillarum TaxID=105358 RepID=UPI003A8A16D1